MHPRLPQFTKYFLRLGTIGFGGPIALCAQMKVELVDKNKWFTLQEYEEGFAFSQSAPGPVAIQLAMYLGFIRFGVFGATAGGLAFIATPFVLVLLLSYFYVSYGTLGVIESALKGVSPAVIAVILHAAFQLGRGLLRELKKWLIAAVSLFLAVFAKIDLSIIIIGAGLIGLGFMILQQRGLCGSMIPLYLLGAHQISPVSGDPGLSILPKLAWLFFKAGALTFGSGYVVVAFIQQGVVDEYQWLNVRQFLDGIAVGQITPGPVVITSTFVGYLVHGLSGAIVSTVAVLLPVYLITIVGAPLIAKYRSSPLLQGFMSAANAAAIGVITSVAVMMTGSAVVDWKTGAIMVLSLAALFLRNVPSVIVILVAGVLGAILF